MKWYRDTEAELVEVAAAVQSQRPIRLGRLESSAKELVSLLKRNDELIVEALANPPGSPLVTNLLNVAILGTKVGIGLGYYGTELERLALAGLVHDIGLFAVPQSLVTKTGRLTQDERLLIEQHPELGYQVIRRAGAEYEWLAQVIRQAHERLNGQGYPNRLKGRQISEIAQILGVVDVFDALVSHRPYRRRLRPHEAVRELLVAERATFPREIVKALVEQLSVYPLGTSVRLTTGEVGTVVSVNTRYPLRPVVRVGEEAGIEGTGARLVDLSLTPLVSIVEAVDSPVVGRVTFGEAQKRLEAKPVPIAASDNFTSLLESLDAIASAIQDVVETRITATKEAERSEDLQRDDRPVRNLQTDQSDQGFKKEIVGLFALEAREWLAQIETALKKLGTGVNGPVRSKLYGFILNGITNLAKSASTVQLDEIEAMASNLLPLLREVGGAGAESLQEKLQPLQRGLDRIASAVRRLAEGRAAENGEVDRGGDHCPQADGGAVEAVPASTSCAVVPSMSEPARVRETLPLLEALRELQRARARSLHPARDVLDAVIQRAEQETGEDPSRVDVGTVERILRDLDRLDEEFLREVNERVPAMTEMLVDLRQQGVEDFVTASQLDPILAHVEALHDFSKGINAVTILMFLQGLKSFLTSMAYRKVDALPQRLEAIELRLKALVPMAEQWVTLGRLERAAIEEILPS